MRHRRPRLVRIARVRFRRALARIERSAPDWYRDVTPWGTSLALHGAALLILALVYLAGRGQDRGRTIEARALFADQLGEDLTSLAPSDRAGDPFGPRTDEPPSLVLDPSKIDPNRINLPTLPPDVRLGPQLVLDAIDRLPDPRHRVVEDGVGLGVHVGVRAAPFSGRQGDARAKLVRREGGTVESEKAVEIGLDWLARHQRPNGSWGLDTRPQCKGDGCPPDDAYQSDTAATGLALLPLLGAGQSHVEPGRYQQNIKLGLAWLIKTQGRDGDLFTGGIPIGRMYSHAIGTMALCEAYGITRDKRLRDPAQRAINFLVRAQNRFDGGWRYEPGASGDTSVFGWALFALRSARLAGLSVPKGTLRRCKEYLDNASADDYRTTYAYQPGKPATPVMTAEALLGRQILGWARDYPPMVKGAAHVAAHLDESQERNIYYWYYATQMLHNLGGPDWKRWNVRVRDGLVAMQVTGEGCDRGSWDPMNPQPDQWGKSAGRLYVTSLSLLTLEVYYRYLPLYRTADTKKADEGDDVPDPEPAGDAAGEGQG